MNKEITLKEDMETAKKGEVFVRGDLSLGVPSYYKDGKSSPEDWYWAKGSKLEDSRFLPASCFPHPLAEGENKTK